MSNARAKTRAIGISVHTGWGACVVVSGSTRKPEIVANKVVELLGDAERFCYHRAAEMDPGIVPGWLAQIRAKALGKARSELSPLMQQVHTGAIVAKDGNLPDLQAVLASHMRIHSAEGSFYRDVFREACEVPCRIITAASLDITALDAKALGMVAKPWGRDQKLAALAALRTLHP
jgi:hypothetical protein